MAVLAGCASGSGALRPPPAPPAQSESAQAGPGSETRDEAAALWLQRADEGALKRAVELWSARLERRPADRDTTVRLLRALHFAARRDAATDPGAARTHHDRALQLADAALTRLHPTRTAPPAAGLTEWLAQSPTDAVELLYLRALHQLAVARSSGLARRAFHTPAIREALEHCQRVAPELDHGGPDRALGTLFAHPTDASLRDLERSQAHHAAALRIAPRHPDNLLGHARGHALAAHDWDSFAARLRAVIQPDAPVPESWAPEAALAREEAERMLRDATAWFE